MTNCSICASSGSGRLIVTALIDQFLNQAGGLYDFDMIEPQFTASEIPDIAGNKIAGIAAIASSIR